MATASLTLTRALRRVAAGGTLPRGTGCRCRYRGLDRGKECACGGRANHRRAHAAVIFRDGGGFPAPSFFFFLSQNRTLPGACGPAAPGLLTCPAVKQRFPDYNEDDCRTTRVLPDGIGALAI